MKALKWGCIGATSCLVQIEQAKDMLEHSYVATTSAAGAKQRIEIVRFNTDAESVGKVVTTRAEELHADAVVGVCPLPSINYDTSLSYVL